MLENLVNNMKNQSENKQNNTYMLLSSAGYVAVAFETYKSNYNCNKETFYFNFGICTKSTKKKENIIYINKIRMQASIYNFAWPILGKTLAS